MILPFSTKLNGKDTLFVEKITQGLLNNPELSDLMRNYEWPKNELYQHHWSCRNDLKDKLHTIREDRSNRWKAGNNIHFVINNRTKKQWQFAPILKVVSVQNIEIEITGNIKQKFVRIWVDGEALNDKGVLKLAHNDGFETIEQFSNTFYDMHGRVFFGKIIHWTNLKY